MAEANGGSKWRRLVEEPAVAAEVGLQSFVMKQHGWEASFSGCTRVDHDVSNSRLSLSAGQRGGAVE